MLRHLLLSGWLHPLAPLKRLSTVDYPAHLNIIQKIILRMVATCGGNNIERFKRKVVWVVE